MLVPHLLPHRTWHLLELVVRFYLLVGSNCFFLIKLQRNSSSTKVKYKHPNLPTLSLCSTCGFHSFNSRLCWTSCSGRMQNASNKLEWYAFKTKRKSIGSAAAHVVWEMKAMKIKDSACLQQMNVSFQTVKIEVGRIKCKHFMDMRSGISHTTLIWMTVVGWSKF